MMDATVRKAKAAHIFERDGLDWYCEPESATKALLSVERFPGETLDPACGGGNIVRSFLEAGCIAVGADIRRRVPEGTPWFLGEADFLATADVPFQNICMNPPFFKAKGAQAFIRHALALVPGKVAAFVDLKFLAGGKRANGIYRELPPHRIWIITPRPSCPPGEYIEAGGKAAGGTADWCWLVWDNASPHQATVADWLRGEP